MIRVTFCAALLAAAPLAAQQPADSVYELRAVEVAPRPLNGAELAAALNAGYPAALRDAGVSGTVRVSMIVGTDGVPREPRVVESADTAFDAPTLAAVTTLRFSPAELSGRPVNVRVELPVVWQADSSPEAVAAARAAAADTVKVISIADATEQPRMLNRDEFVRELERTYPPDARDRGITANVTVRVQLGSDGVPRAVSIVTTTDESFNLPTMQSVAVLRFSPGKLRGRAVPVQFDLPIRWQIWPSSSPAPDRW